MTYAIETTQAFDNWLQKIKDKKTLYRLDARFDRIIDGQFGDYKGIAQDLFELRFFFGGGLRVYYTVRNGQVVL
ncbi:MAG TPA: addiction module antitoxin RelB, partial [Oceanospirillaceae bacterium]|nr:addiction module antitoxin RelB [Oceanospirillaceae bacterium]